MIQLSESVVLPTMSPPKKSIVVLQHNMAKHEPVVTPMVLITQRTEPVVMSMVPPKNVSQHTTPQYKPVVAQTTVSTTLAKAEQPKNVEIPPKFRQYGKVFSDEEA